MAAGNMSGSRMNWRGNRIGSREAEDIAARSMMIAERLCRACHIMWFVGRAESDGTSYNIPWYWNEAHFAERNNDRAAYRVFVISDMASLKRFIELEGPQTRQVLALRPTELNLTRHPDFIAAVGTPAKSADLPIILSGSTLAHAYYQLRKIGCTIVTPTEKEHSRVQRAVGLGKLVRDKVPARPQAANKRILTAELV